MKKHTSKLIALVLALCLCLSLSVSAFAAEIDSSGGSGSTPVNLSSTSDGTEGGDPSATAMRVTVPTALPMAMSQDGDVTTANNCQIVNHSYDSSTAGLNAISLLSTFFCTSGRSSVRRIYLCTCLSLSFASAPTLATAHDFSPTWREVDLSSKSTLFP